MSHSAPVDTRQRVLGVRKKYVKRARATPAFEYLVVEALLRRVDLSACGIRQAVSRVPLPLAGFKDAAGWMREAIPHQYDQ